MKAIIEMCVECDEPTGKAGRCEDSIYCSYCDCGPLCDDCCTENAHGEPRCPGCGNPPMCKDWDK